MDTRRAWRNGSSEQQFDYDEILLAQGRYKEWFYEGLQESQLAYLRQPARVDKVEQEPVEYDQWEAEQPRKWQHDAACRDIDPEVLFQSKAAYLKPDAAWRRLCPQCPVRETCLQAARDSGSVGVWGGVFRHHPKGSSNLRKVEELDDRISNGQR